MNRRDLLTSAAAVLYLQGGKLPLFGGRLAPSGPVPLGSVAASGATGVSGIGGPSNVAMFYNSCCTTSIASFTAGGAFAGIPTFTLGGLDAAAVVIGYPGVNSGFYLGGVNGLALVYNGIQNPNPPDAVYRLTITGTDGVTTLSKSLTVTVGTNASMLHENVVYDSSPTNGWYGQPIANTAYVTQSDGNRNLTLTDPSGTFIYDAGSGYVLTKPGLVLADHIGSYPVTITPNGGPPQQTTLVIAHEFPPVVKLIFDTVVYDNQPVLPVGTQDNFSYRYEVGTIKGFSDLGIQHLTLSSSDNSLIASVTSKVYAKSVLVPGTGKSVSLTASSFTGKPATINQTYDIIARGTGGTITAAIRSDLDNSMGDTLGQGIGPVTVGTVSVAGLAANPTWSIDMVDDLAQNLRYDASGISKPRFPRYTITATGSNTAVIKANYLSAQTDTIIIDAVDSSGLRSTSTQTVVVAAKVGPTLQVGPGKIYATWNAALDAWWQDQATYNGSTIILNPQDYSQDFSRVQIGHGSNQQWPPGPATYKGISAANKTLIDFGPRGIAQGAIRKFGSDLTLQFIDVRNVTNICCGEGNAGGIYSDNEQAGNLTILDSSVSNCDINIMNGDVGGHLVMRRCWTAMGGAGAGGLTHNIYAGHYSTVELDNCLSFATAQVHEFKTRAAKNTLTNSRFIDGENGRPGSSSVLDFPLGGINRVVGCLMHKGPSPNNDGNIIQFCAEIDNGGPIGGAWPTNTLEVDTCTFLATAAPPSFTSQVSAVNMAGFQYTPYRSHLTGELATAVVRNCGFYNIKRSQWFSGNGSDNYLNGGPVVDGGGNFAITTWPGLTAIDPSTGVLITNKPERAYNKYVNDEYPGIVLDPLSFEMRAALNAPSGTPLDTAYVYGKSGVPLTNVTWSLTNQIHCTYAGDLGTATPGMFYIDSSGVMRVAGTVQDGLYYFLANASGTDATTSGTRIFQKWFFVVGGPGTITPMP